MACDNCDLLIAIGCRFSDRVALDPKTFASKAYIVHIDIDRAEINKNIKTDHHIIGDAKQILTQLNERVTQQEHKEWTDFVFSYPTEVSYDEVPGILTPDQVLEVIAKRLPMDTMVATDVGQHQMWAIQHFHFDYPGQLMTSGGFGAMGFGLGAAIGAKQGNPEKTVAHITGDGSFRMNCNELATEEYYKLPVITFIFNNGCHAAVYNKEGRMKNAIYVRHGEKLVFGENKEYGLKQEGFGLKVVKIGENGVTLDDILVHDAHCEDSTLQQKLAIMSPEDGYPIALGVIRDVEAPTYDEAVNQQIEELKAQKPYHNFMELLETQDTWEVK